MDGLRDTVLGFYDAVADPALWPEQLQRLADQIDAKGCIVFEMQTAPQGRRLTATMASAFYDPAVIAGYIEKCFDAEIEDQLIFEAHSLKADGIDLIEDDVIATSRERLAARQNVAALQRFGIFHRAAGLLDKDNSAQSRFSIQLGADRGRFTHAARVPANSVALRCILDIAFPHGSGCCALSHRSLVPYRDAAAGTGPCARRAGNLSPCPGIGNFR